ncbi:prenyltransferase [compost metagenome]
MRPTLSILIYTNSWVALCVTSLVYGIASHFQLKHTELFALWSFTGTVSAYQLHRLFRLRHLKHTVRSNRRLLWMQNTYPFQVAWFGINFICCLICTLYIPLTAQTALLIGIDALIVALYALPFPVLGNGIRHLPFAKNILISASWVLIILVPFASMKTLDSLSWEIPTLLFIAVFAQIIPFDSRDVVHDPKSLSTIPQLVGADKARYVGFILLIAALALQTHLLGFHWLLPFTLFCGAVGHLIPFLVGYQLRLEFMWELPLGLMGLWFLIA